MDNTKSNFPSITPQRVRLFLIPGIFLISFRCQFYTGICESLHICHQFSPHITDEAETKANTTERNNWRIGITVTLVTVRTYLTSQWVDLRCSKAAELYSLEYVAGRLGPCPWSSSVRLIAKGNENAKSERCTSVYVIQRVSQPHFNIIRSWIRLGPSSNRGTLKEPCQRSHYN